MRRTRAGQEIVGTSGDDVILGTRGDDTILADPNNGNLGGNDVVYGGAGDDNITAHNIFFEDDDTVYGGRGNDTISLGRGHDVANGGRGDDTISVSMGTPLVPFNTDDGVDTVIFDVAGKGFGHDTVTELQQGDTFMFVDKSGGIDSVDDLAAATRLVDIGQNAYEIEWLQGDQSVSLYLDNDYLNFGKAPEDQVNWDDFTTVEQLATVLNFQFDHPLV